MGIGIDKLSKNLTNEHKETIQRLLKLKKYKGHEVLSDCYNNHYFLAYDLVEAFLNEELWAMQLTKADNNTQEFMLWFRTVRAEGDYNLWHLTSSSHALEFLSYFYDLQIRSDRMKTAIERELLLKTEIGYCTTIMRNRL